MIVSEKKVRIYGPESVVLLIWSLLGKDDEFTRDQEHFYVVGLNGNHVSIYCELVTLGLANRTLVHPREVFRRAVSRGATAIIAVHNHPSGNIEPSADDRIITNQLKEAGEIIGINLLDHIIVDNCQGAFRSFSNEPWPPPPVKTVKKKKQATKSRAK